MVCLSNPSLVCPLSACSSTSTDQAIFTIATETWLNFRTGDVSVLVGSNQTVFTFDPQYDGQTAQDVTDRADATVLTQGEC